MAKDAKELKEIIEAQNERIAKLEKVVIKVDDTKKDELEAKDKENAELKALNEKILADRDNIVYGTKIETSDSKKADEIMKKYEDNE